MVEENGNETTSSNSMRRRCAYLTMNDLSDFVSDAELSFGPMAELGWEVDMVSWRDAAVNWDDYDLVYICTPWDYQQSAEAFLRVLQRIDHSRARLVNSLSLVRWNLRKEYLRELEDKGAAIVPSLWRRRFDAAQVRSWFDAHGTGRIVVKPVVGANADDTFVLSEPVPSDMLEALAAAFTDRPFFVQPYLDSINREGEYSLFFFGGEYSHAILKKPKAGDFRSQEEHGADILSVEAPAALIATATRIVGLVEPRPVYVRADLLRGIDDRFLLMELELIEPSLYFRTDPDAAYRFARAVTRSVL